MRHGSRTRVPRLVILAAVSAGSLGLAGLLALAVMGSAQAEPTTVSAELRDEMGKFVGNAKFSQEADSVLVRVTVEGLSKGFHGIHVHEAGDCTPPFTLAGGHFNPTNSIHGDHAGDLPVLQVNADGRGDLRFASSSFDLSELLEGNGTALIIHAGPDNYANIPDRYMSGLPPLPGPDTTTAGNGDSGKRIACAVLAP
jgi:superoxide dismutase, Cu-Zn family